MSDRDARNGAWVARAGAFIWVLSGVTVLLDGYVIVVEAGRAGGFLVDRFFLPVICGLLAAGAFAVATSGVLLRGRDLVAVDVVRITEVDAGQISEVDDLVGLAVRTRDGHAVQPYVCQGGLVQQLGGNRRRKLAAARIRAWLAADDEAGDETGAQVVAVAPVRRRLRWTVLAGVPLWALATGALTVALHAVLH